ncbi:MAG: SpoIID/LytB domain-containing protein, partial [Parachlamydiales bacterium]
HIAPKSKNSSLLVNGIEYDGAITVIKVKNKINVINDVEIESYLKSILTPQFPYPLENEVMAAVAIASRTTACSNVVKNKNAFWHVSAEDVNYQGKVIVQPDSHVSNAVDRTKHLILVLSNKGSNNPFIATWTENSAGKTAPYSTIFRKEALGPQVGVEAPHAALIREESKWNYKISKKQFENLLNISGVTGVELYTDNFSKKTYALKLKSMNESKDIDFITFQKILGKENVISNDMQVVVMNNDVLFTGYGKGIGVGICLHSATQMAQNGDNAAKILSKFFPDTYLLNLSATPLKSEIK